MLCAISLQEFVHSLKQYSLFGGRFLDAVPVSLLWGLFIQRRLLRRTRVVKLPGALQYFPCPELTWASFFWMPKLYSKKKKRPGSVLAREILKYTRKLNNPHISKRILPARIIPHSCILGRIRDVVFPEYLCAFPYHLLARL